MILLLFGCDNINLFNIGNDFSTTEEEILPMFDCADAQNISGAKNSQKFLALRITPPAVPFKVTEVHMKSLVIEEQDCDVLSIDYQLYFSPYILSNPMEGELLVANVLEPEGIQPDIDILESQHILDLEQVIDEEGYMYVVIDTSEESLCIPHCITENDVESLYERDSRWEIYESVNGEVDYPFALKFEW
jgi:hypothetical protein